MLGDSMGTIKLLVYFYKLQFGRDLGKGLACDLKMKWISNVGRIHNNTSGHEHEQRVIWIPINNF